MTADSAALAEIPVPGAAASTAAAPATGVQYPRPVPAKGVIGMAVQFSPAEQPIASGTVSLRVQSEPAKPSPARPFWKRSERGTPFTMLSGTQGEVTAMFAPVTQVLSAAQSTNRVFLKTAQNRFHFRVGFGHDNPDQSSRNSPSTIRQQIKARVHKNPREHRWLKQP